MNKVWAFTIGRPLSQEETEKILNKAQSFASNWTAHENKLSAKVSIKENCVLLIEVDEKVYTATGCSIDKLLRIVKSLEAEFQVELLNRLLVPVELANGFEVLSSSQIKSQLENKILSPETHILNTAISNEDELSTWKQPIQSSWLSKFIKTT